MIQADMDWLQVQIDLGDLPTEPVEQALIDVGAVTIEYSDGGDSPIFEPAPGTSPVWKTTRLSALFDAGVSETAIQLSIAKSIAPSPMPRIEFDWIEDRDWVQLWKQTQQPMQFGRDLWVCAPGTTSPVAPATTIHIEPGLGFGTGSHATTRMCLAWLAGQPLHGKAVLDFGCGSGILAIASLALGASRATAVDIDAHALTATRENAQRNDCLAQLRILSARDLEQTTHFDLIVANILSNTLIELQKDLQDHARRGTGLVLSGILTAQAADVVSAYEPWITLTLAAEHDDWVMLTGTVN